MIWDRPFGPLCRAAAPEKGLCKRAVTTEEISAFLNALLSSTDPASSHSLKHTTLEWASAYGIDEDARKLLGHHSLSGGKALAVYSRDLLNRPLQLYCSMRDLFRPDESRTSRLIDSMNIQAGTLKKISAEDKQDVVSEQEDRAESEASRVSVPLEVQKVSASEDGESSSSSSSASEESNDEQQHDVERHDWISGPVWRNRRSKVVHKVSHSDSSTACGSQKFEHLQSGCSTLFARCGICFRGEVVTCVDGLADAFKSASAKRARKDKWHVSFHPGSNISCMTLSGSMGPGVSGG